MSRETTERRRASPAVIALLAVALILAGAWAALPHGVFWHSDEGAKFLQLVNLRLTPAGLDTAILYPGRATDPTLTFAPFHPRQRRVDASGAIYLQWPIFLPLLSAPFYALLGMAGLYLLPLGGALLACWLAYRLSLAAGAAARVAWWAIPLTGLCTPVGFYGWVYFEHTLAAALVAGATLLALRGLAGGRGRSLAGAGALLGAAIYLRSELYVLVLVFGVALGARALGARRGAPDAPTARRVLAAGAGAGAALALTLLPLWLYYTQSEGGPLPQHATWYFESAEPPVGAAPDAGPRLPEVRYLARAGLGIVPDFLAGPNEAGDAPVPPWAAAAITLGTLGALLGGWARRDARVFAGGLALTALGSAPALLTPQAYGALHGFVLAAPLALCAAAAPGRARDDPARPLAGIAGLYVLLHVLIISTLSGLGPISRYEWGQRYLLPAYPLLIALAVVALGRLRETVDSASVGAGTARLTLALAGALALIGAGFLARGWATMRADEARTLTWAAAVAAAPDPALITDRWWLPLLLAPDFYQRTWFLAPDAATAAGWPAQAARAGLRRFTAVTPGGDLPAILLGAQPAPQPGAAQSVDGLTLQPFALAPGVR
jgi:hypothetical protein